MLTWMLGLPRSIKRLLSVFADVGFLVSSLFAAYFLTQQNGQADIPQIAISFAITLPITLLVFTKLGPLYWPARIRRRAYRHCQQCICLIAVI